jgi:hypothetical protein
VLRGWGEELPRRDNVDKRKRKKRLVRLQVQTYRSNYPCKERPAKKYL